MKAVQDQIAKMASSANKRSTHGLDGSPLAFGADYNTGQNSCQPLEVRGKGVHSLAQDEGMPRLTRLLAFCRVSTSRRT